MRVGIWLTIIMLCFGGPATAQSTNTSASSVTVPGWDAVGRLNISGRSMCTGALIAPDLVLTAAHCLYDVHTGRAVDPRKIEFASGLTSCQVEFGASGAPVFAVQGGGQPRLVSVISSKAAMGNKQVSLGTVLDRALERLIARAG